MYLALKHSHLFLVLLSVGFFVVRFVLAWFNSPFMQKKLVKIAPHIIDTLLLGSAVGLMFTISQYPFVNLWLTEKLVAVVAYILLGVMAFKGRTKFLRLICFFGALGWLVLVARLAITKTPVLFG